jgi:polysaccharide biosynthesis protein PslH
MKVLVIDEEIPFPPNSGKRIRTYNLLAPLAARHEIVFVCRYHEGAENDRHGFERCGIKPIVVPDPIPKKSGPNFYASLARNIVSKYPYVVASHYSRILRQKVSELLDNGHFDLIHCEWTPYLVNVPRCNIPLVVDAHNVESTIWRRYFLNEKNPVRKMYIYLQSKKMERFEGTFLASASRVIAVSENDRAEVIRWQGKCSVIENGVDIDYFCPNGSAAVPHSLVFCGGLDWRPNVDAVIYFLDEIWPIVSKNYPRCTLTLVGRNPVPNQLEYVLRAKGVRLTGTVADVRPYIRNSSVVIVPLRIGSGSRLKILEAFAMGKPVVSTSVGAEGLRVRDEQEILLADTPDKFAERVSRLFEDNRLGDRLGREGRRLVEKEYQWKMLSEKLESLWQETTAPGRVC